MVQDISTRGSLSTAIQICIAVDPTTYDFTNIQIPLSIKFKWSKWCRTFQPGDLCQLQYRSVLLLTPTTHHLTNIQIPLSIYIQMVQMVQDVSTWESLPTAIQICIAVDPHHTPPPHATTTTQHKLATGKWRMCASGWKEKHLPMQVAVRDDHQYRSVLQLTKTPGRNILYHLNTSCEICSKLFQCLVQ